MPVPDRFCWTRFGTEAGQTISSILARKEKERVANRGMFLWGIGSAIGPSIRELLLREAEPEALFSPIKSAPKPEDVNPSAVAAWTKATMLDGDVFSIPEASLILSRHDGAGAKRAHYALVCYSREPLDLAESCETIALDQMRNLLTGRPIGASQVTAVVKHDESGSGQGRFYPVALRAQLVYPYFLQLSCPRLVYSKPT